MGYKQHDAGTRKTIETRVRDLIREGRKYAEIAATLTLEGLRRPNGANYDASTVGAVVAAVKTRGGRFQRVTKTEVAAATTPSASLVEFISEVVQSNLNSRTKVAVLAARFATKSNERLENRV